MSRRRGLHGNRRSQPGGKARETNEGLRIMAEYDAVMKRKSERDKASQIREWTEQLAEWARRGGA